MRAASKRWQGVKGKTLSEGDWRKEGVASVNADQLLSLPTILALHLPTPSTFGSYFSYLAQNFPLTFGTSPPYPSTTTYPLNFGYWRAGDDIEIKEGLKRLIQR